MFIVGCRMGIGTGTKAAWFNFPARSPDRVVGAASRARGGGVERWLSVYASVWDPRLHRVAVMFSDIGAKARGAGHGDGPCRNQEADPTETLAMLGHRATAQPAIVGTDVHGSAAAPSRSPFPGRRSPGTPGPAPCRHGRRPAGRVEDARGKLGFEMPARSSYCQSWSAQWSSPGPLKTKYVNLEVPQKCRGSTATRTAGASRVQSADQCGQVQRPGRPLL